MNISKALNTYENQLAFDAQHYEKLNKEYDAIRKRQLH